MSKRNKKKSGNSSAPDAIPEEFLVRLKEIVPVGFWPQVEASLNLPKAAAFRWNPLQPVPKETVIDSLTMLSIQSKPVAWFDDGFLVDYRQRELLVDSPATNNSEIYLQNPSSWLPCLVLAPQPGEQVLDLAAAPGGKTLLLAALMQNRGKLSAVEPVRSRFFKLQANLKRYGDKITKTYLSDGRSVGRKVAGRFDRVLLDTPCSGESRIHAADPKSFQFWSERKLKEQSRKQYGLIRSAFESLSPGGKLVYCTCSFAPEENEQIVSDFLKDHETAKLNAIETPDGVAVQAGITEWKGKKFQDVLVNAVRVIPDQVMNGFFIASISKMD